MISGNATHPSDKKFCENYTENFSISARVRGAVQIALIALFTTSYILLITGQLTALPQHFTNLFTHINLTNLAIGLSVVSIAVAGVSCVIYRALTTEDPLIESCISPRPNHEEYIQEVHLFSGEDFFKRAYLDSSTLDEQQNGKAYLYAIKSPQEHYFKVLTISLGNSLHTIGAIVYHAIRFCIIPFYILGCLAIEAYKGEACFERQGRFKVKALILEPLKSLKQVITSPFYGIASVVATLYGLKSPIRGRILESKIARDWNGGKYLSEGIWLTQPEKLWAGWQELGPKKLGGMKYFLAGCYQPIGVVTIENGVIIEAISKSRVIGGPSSGYEFSVQCDSV